MGQLHHHKCLQATFIVKHFTKVSRPAVFHLVTYTAPKKDRICSDSVLSFFLNIFMNLFCLAKVTCALLLQLVLSLEKKENHMSFNVSLRKNVNISSNISGFSHNFTFRCF